MTKSPLALAVVLGVIAQQAAAAGFVEDSKATLGLRNFYYDNNVKHYTPTATAPAGPSTQEWAQGFLFNYTSGFTQGTVGFGLDVVALGAIKLDSGGRVGKSTTELSRSPGSLFPLESDGSATDSYGKAGATAKVRVSKTEGRLGTLQPKLPVVTFNDGRVLPQLFNGGQITSNEIDGLTLIAGQLENTKTRSSTDNVGLRIGGATRPAGTPTTTLPSDSNKFYYAGGDYKITKDLTAQYYYGNLDDFYKQHFLGLIHNWAIGPGVLKSDLRYFDSSSDGKNGSASGRADGYGATGYYGNTPAGAAIVRGEVDNRTWSSFFTYTLGAHALSAGYQQVSGDSAFPFLNQGDGSTAYLITDRQIGKFANAGERTWVTEYGYDFASVGVPGLKTVITYLKGDNIDTAAGDAKEWERDFRIDYVLQTGTLKGLGLTWRNASQRGNFAADNDENRLIVSYTLPLL